MTPRSETRHSRQVSAARGRSHMDQDWQTGLCTKVRLKISRKKQMPSRRQKRMSMADMAVHGKALVLCSQTLYGAKLGLDRVSVGSILPERSLLLGPQ